MSSDRRGAGLAQQRQERLLQLLRAHGSVLVSAAAVELGVSEMTVRRDIDALAARRLAVRVHGGAVLPGASPSGAVPSDGPVRVRWTVGMVVPQLDYYFPSVIAGARTAAVEAGVRLLLRTSSYDIRDDKQQIRSLAQTPGLDGMILAPDVDSPESPALVHWLDRQPLPVVLAERRPPDGLPVSRLEWVGSDHADGTATAVRHLLQQGHRRLGLLSAEHSPTSKHLRRGWVEALTAAGLDPAEQLVGHSDGLAGAGRRALVEQLLQRCRARQVTALVVHPDPCAVALVQHCVDTGTSVPGDLAIVAYDDEFAALSQPPLTAVMPPKAHVGRVAVELMVARLAEGDRRPPHRVTVSPRLNVRESSRRPAA
ncbi:DeoR family transcriptional regulator [Auraticoccus sp. F435]|uniref:DeoR family transcriptional regulator n=1 Tax=Auraticoccus cholistanensis TaxID=2656650 RepID=A0A6A9UUX6_9ACTN|nr:substrate-binding domain-containing protein [Auraticoccus cholistanensis]MVA76623.1 DeoR family transcriptional regulator [Auraticoccus cholistanensis]